MAKTIEQKLTTFTGYKIEFGDRPLSDTDKSELERFNNDIGFTIDRRGTLVKFIKQGYTNWVAMWKKHCALPNSTLESNVLLYGEVEGTRRYLHTNIKKTSHFDHSHEVQLARGLLAAKKLKGSKTHSIRSVGYWINKGMTAPEATAKVSEIQTTNTVEKYINKHGEKIGLEKFNLRKATWKNTMSSPEIGKRRSLGLARYIERYGELAGTIKYLAMRKKRNEIGRIGKASNESIAALSEIVELIHTHDYAYYMGIPTNKEWFIYDAVLKRAFFYDLTIPALGVIIEYHGEGFHPNPTWDIEKWNNWKSVFSDADADSVYKVDQYKRHLAENAGWTVYEVYSSSSADSRRVIYEHIYKLIS
jgi:hypothetical protein